MDFSILLVFWAGFGLALLSPGPNFAMLLGTAARDGRGPALRCAAGMAAGELVWGFAAVWGVAALALAHEYFGHLEAAIAQFFGICFIDQSQAFFAQLAEEQLPGFF